MQNATDRFLLAIAGLLALTAPASAITYASGAGTDNAACGAVTTPCRTLQQAATNAPAGGYVVLQGPGDFQPATISKALTIVGEKGAFVSGLNTYGMGLLVLANATDVVRLRNLAINEAPPAAAAIYTHTLKRMEIDNCRFVNSGVMTTHAGQLLMVDSITVGAQLGSSDGGMLSYFERVVSSTSVFTNGAHSGATVIADSSISAPASLPAVYSPGWSAYLRDTVVTGGSSSLRGDTFFLSRATLTGAGAVNSATNALLTFGDNIIRGNSDDTLPPTVLRPYH